MAEYPLWAASRTVREGLSARAGLAAYRAAGGRVTDANWFRMVAEVRTAVGDRIVELGRPLNRRPLADERTVWTTRTASGMIQQVEVMVRDLDTGLISVIPYSHKTQRGTTRQHAIDAAIAFIEDGSETYGEQVIGAFHVGTFQMVPGE